MRTVGLLVAGASLAILVLIACGLLYLRTTGLRARGEAGPLETSLALRARRLAIPASARERPNPVARSPEAIADGMAHYADHCATCHANDGSGGTEMGRSFYPKAPDMRLPATQELTDGELFHVIEHGIRFTGMPAWSTGTIDGEASTWRLVHFLRHLPQLTSTELEAMRARNPRSPEEIRFEIEEQRFLNGEP